MERMPAVRRAQRNGGCDDDMSDQNLARRAEVSVSFAGVDITKDLRPYLKSLTYTDNEEGEADDLQLSLQDREGLWLESWLTEAVEAAAAGRLSIGASIRRKNWRSDGKDDVLPCGSFELDSVEASGPPAVVTIRATALPFSAAVRQTKKSRAWENYALSGIAREIAGAAGLGCLYESAADPFYKRVEQLKTSDVSFLSKLCKDAGISLKATDSQLVLFDQAAYEAKPPVMTVKRADARRPLAGVYTKYRLSAGAAGTQYASCRVSYVDPSSGKCIEGTAQAEGMDAKSGQCLEISARVASAGGAAALAEKHLRLHNKLERTAVLTLPGTSALVAGVTVALEGWGGWSGKYIVSQAVHTVGEGYTTQVRLRRCLKGY